MLYVLSLGSHLGSKPLIKPSVVNEVLWCFVLNPHRRLPYPNSQLESRDKLRVSSLDAPSGRPIECRAREERWQGRSGSSAPRHFAQCNGTGVPRSSETSTPIGLTKVPEHMAIAGSYGWGVSYERGTPGGVHPTRLDPCASFGRWFLLVFNHSISLSSLHASALPSLARSHTREPRF